MTIAYPPMRKILRPFLLCLFWVMATAVSAQLTGVVLDKQTGDSIPFSSLIYKGNQIAVAAGPDGRFSI